MNKPALRTSIADRLDKAGLAEAEYEKLRLMVKIKCLLLIWMII